MAEEAKATAPNMYWLLHRDPTDPPEGTGQIIHYFNREERWTRLRTKATPYTYSEAVALKQTLTPNTRSKTSIEPVARVPA